MKDLCTRHGVGLVLLFPVAPQKLQTEGKDNLLLSTVHRFENVSFRRNSCFA